MATYLENLLGPGILINVAVAGVILPRMLHADLQRRFFYCLSIARSISPLLFSLW